MLLMSLRNAGETMISGKSCKILLTTCMVKMALVPTSHKMKIISLLLAVLMYVPGVQAHTGDWQAVEKLTPGTRISVRAQHRTRCVFQRATDDELACKRLYRSLALSSEIVFDRESAREVRLETQRRSKRGSRSANRSWRGRSGGRQQWEGNSNTRRRSSPPR
jgi:hypothetical protein